MRIAITGANGFIGSQLVNYFITNGYEVLLLQRNQPAKMLAGATYAHYDLNDPTVLPALENVDALIHTAYMPYTTTNGANEKNVQGTLALYNLCLAKQIYFVFLSSMSAHENALSVYGKHKYELQNTLDTHKCLILRLGLVIGQQGLFSRLNQSLRKSPFVFLAGGGQQPIQPVYIDDVVKVIVESLSIKRTGIYTLAEARVYTMRELFMAIAKKAGKKPVFIDVPYWVVATGINFIELLHLPFPVSKENLLGLKQLQSFDTRSDLEKLSIRPVSLKEALQRL